MVGLLSRSDSTLDGQRFMGQSAVDYETMHCTCAGQMTLGPLGINSSPFSTGPGPVIAGIALIDLPDLVTGHRCGLIKVRSSTNWSVTVLSHRARTP